MNWPVVNNWAEATFLVVAARDSVAFLTLGDLTRLEPQRVDLDATLTPPKQIVTIEPY